MIYIEQLQWGLLRIISWIFLTWLATFHYTIELFNPPESLQHTIQGVSQLIDNGVRLKVYYAGRLQKRILKSWTEMKLVLTLITQINWISIFVNHF